MGFFSIPTVKRSPNGILALVLCILLSGIGTIIVGAISKEMVGQTQKNVIILGVIQLVVAIVTFGIGGLWALIWGIIVFVRSN